MKNVKLENFVVLMNQKKITPVSHLLMNLNTSVSWIHDLQVTHRRELHGRSDLFRNVHPEWVDHFKNLYSNNAFYWMADFW